MIDISWLAQNGPCKIFTAGQSIPCPGGDDEIDRAMYILLVGRVDVTGAGGKALTSISLFPGDVFGGREYFTGKIDSVYTAAVDSVVYVISETSFNDLSWAQPDILFEVLKAAYIPPGRPTVQVRLAEGKEATAAQGAAAAAQGAAAASTAAATSAAAAANTAAAAAQGVDIANNAAAAAAPQAAVAAAATTAAAAPVDAATAKPAAAPPTATTPTAATAPSANAVAPIPAGGGIFPEGHKRYPGITKPNFVRLVYPKDYTCPYCKKKFSDYKVFSSKLYEAAPMRYDLRRYYTDFSPEWYDIITCRHCYFSTVSSYFSEGKAVFKQKIETALTEARSSVFFDFDAERDIDFVFTSHYLALLCSDGYLSAALPVRAKIWGNLSWLYEDVGDENMARFASLKAADAYEEVYSGTRMTPIQEQTTCLSIAGMQRRAGIDRNMKKYLFQVKTVKMGDKAYIKIAEDIMEDLRAKGNNES
ncbi:MAG: DUF2225 domain-containing protein [Oscillospiraceae bacterium]|nr:DUF2225 domain-containing protein [Oscillospiraceae bacterium]